jgi:arylsulfatase A-like enzyme
VRLRNSSVLIVAVACAAAGAVAWWMWRSPGPGLWPSRRPNVILITIDTLRPDRLSCYGYTQHRTPHLDRLAQEGVLFENAFCDVTWTTPSMASVMTGRYATAHGLRSSYQRLSPDAVTLAELLAPSGIQTAAIVASYPLAPLFGLDQGFEVYDADFAHSMIDGKGVPMQVRPGGVNEVRQLLFYQAAHSAYRTDTELSDRAIRWLREERREPFFLWLHYFGPHEKPQDTNDFFEQLRRQLREYDPDVVATDVQVGRVLTTLDALGLTAHTAVIVHADHGQSLIEHNYFGHGRYVYDSSQRVPLLMRWPEYLPAGRRVKRMVRNIDLFPTIAELMRVKLTVPVDGDSLLPVIAGGERNGEPEETYVETYLSANRLFATMIGPNEDTPLGFRRFGIRTPQWKFIVNDPIPLLDDDDPAPVTPDLQARYYSQELYDLRADPGETVNVIAAHPDLAAAFRRKMREYQSRRGPGSEKMTLDAASRERLRSLGYLAD